MSMPDMIMDAEKKVMPAEQHNKYLLSLFITVLFLIALCLLWLKLLQPQVLPIKHVKVEGQFSYLKPERLKTISANIVRGGFFNVNVGVIRQQLLAEPWVNSVTVRRVWPDTLVVYVNEQSPVSSWNRHSLINEAGVIFVPEAKSMPTNLPALSGPDGSHTELLALLHTLNQKLQVYKLKIIHLSMDARRSLSLTLNNGTEVKIGNKDIAFRITRFLKYIPPQIISEPKKIKRVDMRYTNGFSIAAASNDAVANRN